MTIRADLDRAAHTEAVHLARATGTQLGRAAQEGPPEIVNGLNVAANLMVGELRSRFGDPVASAFISAYYLNRDCKACLTLAKGHVGPSHDGLLSCRSGSIASGGTKAHCTCDACF